jgi:hypothetical protein
MAQMSNLKELERTIENLSPEDLARFRKWFLEFDWKMWDSKIEDDLKSGKLDRLISEAMNDYGAGKAREL